MYLQLKYFSCIFSHADYYAVLLLIIITTVESKNYFVNFHIISPKFIVFCKQQHFAPVPGYTSKMKWRCLITCREERGGGEGA